jgi:hypothetical protein
MRQSETWSKVAIQSEATLLYWNLPPPLALCRNVHPHEATPMLTTILIIVLILALIGALPHWGYSRGWGYGPGGGVGLILLIIIVLALTGHI